MRCARMTLLRSLFYRFARHAPLSRHHFNSMIYVMSVVGAYYVARYEHWRGAGAVEMSIIVHHYVT